MPQRNNGQRPPVKCALCGRNEEEVDFLIPCPTGRFICSFCIETCYTLVHGADLEESPIQVTRKPSPLKSLPTPQQIKDLLDEYVIGQDKAKIALSVAVYNHYKRIYSHPAKPVKHGENGKDDVDLQKSNVLLIGPTGVGKTFLAQTLAKALDVPFAIADATTLTEAGYVGEDVENILLRLIQAADYDVSKAEKGIIYVDEIDKISRRSENRSITRDVSGEGVQQALLKILEGTLANVPAQGGRKHPTQAMIQINTENILFICGGAFDNLDQIIEQRKGQSGIGFQSNIQKKEEKKKSGIFKDVTPHDIVKYGLIPELVGRLPVIVGLDDLDRDALVKILVEPKNSITKQYKKLLDMDGVDLEFTDEALAAVADKAIARNTGARGLRSILEELLTDIMFSIPSRKDVAKVVITKECVLGQKDPELVLK